MANTLVMREKSYLVHQVLEEIPILEPSYSRVLRPQIGRGVVVGTTQVSFEHSSGTLEEEGELGSRVGTKVEEGVTNIGAIEDECKFKLT